jgi:hypothetical protein
MTAAPRSMMNAGRFPSITSRRGRLLICATAHCPTLFSLSYEYTKSWFAVGLWHSKHAVSLTFSFGFFSRCESAHFILNIFAARYSLIVRTTLEVGRASPPPEPFTCFKTASS